MKSMIRGSRQRPGEHCGSTVMRNMLLHDCGLDTSETLTFGLGSGIECIVLSSPRMTPEAVVFGRSAALEQDLSEALGLDYVEEPEADDEAARRRTGADDRQKRAVLALAENDLGRGETGLAALKLFRDDLPSWREQEDPAWLASYASRTIEVFGNGGGNFPRMYEAFLAEPKAMLTDLVGPELPPLAERSAALWTALSQSLDRIAKAEDQESWSTSVSLIDQILAVETDLFHSLLERFPR